MERAIITHMGGASVGQINSLVLTKIDLLCHLWELIRQKYNKHSLHGFASNAISV